MPQVYTSRMPVDVDAAVISNTRLSDDYSVIALAAPEVASLARPGQFVMVKPSRGADPLLRRPFSIFEILRDGNGMATGITLLNKKIGVGTTRVYQAEPGARISCLGPLGRPFEPIAPPGEAWMVAGGVGLAPFVTLAEAIRSAGGQARLFYGARRASELYYVDRFERMGVDVVLTTEDGSRGYKGYVTGALDTALRSSRTSDIRLYVCGPTPMMRAVADLATIHGTACDVSLEQVMGCGLGGCYSCVVLARDATGTPHHLRSCIEGPVFDATRIVWNALAH
jgi:dihydroorotate dehydrogenase electron transfer subunit